MGCIGVVEAGWQLGKAFFAQPVVSIATGAFITLFIDDLVKQVALFHKDKSMSILRNRLNRIKDFAPSGLSIHPNSMEYYLVSAKGSTLVILNKDRSLVLYRLNVDVPAMNFSDPNGLNLTPRKNIVFLNEQKISQPEGFTFDNDAHLYIASEGKGFRGRGCKFASKH